MENNKNATDLPGNTSGQSMLIHDTDKKQFKPVLSESGIKRIESLLYWFHEETESESFMSNMMNVLSVYIEHCPKDVSQFQKPEWLANHFALNAMTLNQHLFEIVNEEEVWNWKNSIDGFYK